MIFDDDVMGNGYSYSFDYAHLTVDDFMYE